MNITQSKMARAALGWSLDELARAAGIAPRTVAKFETGGNVMPETVEAMRKAFVAQGVDFTNSAKRVGVSCLRQE